MRIPLIGAAALFAALTLLQEVGGITRSFRLAHATLGILSLCIALTFLWLWRVRATPLASGMVLSWAGGGGLIGWWWSYALLGRPDWMLGHPTILAMVSLCLVGACLHFAVIGTCFGWRRGAWILIPVGAVTAAISISFYVGPIAPM